MSYDKFESNIKKHAGEIFGHDKELPAGHRERFEQRLKAFTKPETATEQAVIQRKSGKVIQLKKALIAAIAAAAVITGFIILYDSPVEKLESSELADVRNYYSMQLEALVDETKLLIQNIDSKYKKDLLVSIKRIENEPIPDVQIPDDEYIVLIAGIYSNKIEVLQNLQDLIKENI